LSNATFGGIISRTIWSCRLNSSSKRLSASAFDRRRGGCCWGRRSRAPAEDMDRLASMKRRGRACGWNRDDDHLHVTACSMVTVIHQLRPVKRVYQNRLPIVAINDALDLPTRSAHRLDERLPPEPFDRTLAGRAIDPVASD
jgi:hypothetical protein